jgi:hypothetical protein
LNGTGDRLAGLFECRQGTGSLLISKRCGDGEAIVREKCRGNPADQTKGEYG